MTEIWTQAALWPGLALLAGEASWIQFPAGAGAILLTFLAGAELDPAVFRKKWKRAAASVSSASPSPAPPASPTGIRQRGRVQGSDKNSLQHYRAILEPLKAQAPQARFEVAVGHPAVKITSFAEAKGIDLIVLEHRGKRMFECWLIGPVVKKVMSHAPCSVLTVR